MLTRRQAELLRYLQVQERSPTVDEIADEMLLASKGGVVAHLRRLEERGYIRRQRGKARSIEVLKAAPQRCAYYVWDDPTQTLKKMGG